MERQAGFTLIEAVIGLAILVAVCGGVLAALAAGRVVALRSRQAAIGAAMASARLAELRAGTFTTAPAASAPALAVTPADSLWRDRDGCVDYLDGVGRPVAESGAPAAFVRRWRVGRRGAGAAEVAVVSVLVAPMADAARAAQGEDPRRVERQPGVVVLRGALARRAS